MQSTWFLHPVASLTVVVIDLIWKCIHGIGVVTYAYNAPAAPTNEDVRADTHNKIDMYSSRLLTVASPPDIRSDISHKLLTM